MITNLFSIKFVFLTRFTYKINRSRLLSTGFYKRCNLMKLAMVFALSRALQAILMV